MNSNNSAVSSNVSTGMTCDHPVDVTWSGDRRSSNLLTGQQSSGTMMAQLLSTPGGVSVSQCALIITVHFHSDENKHP